MGSRNAECGRIEHGAEDVAHSVQRTDDRGRKSDDRGLFDVGMWNGETHRKMHCVQNTDVGGLLRIPLKLLLPLSYINNKARES